MPVCLWTLAQFAPFETGRRGHLGKDRGLTSAAATTVEHVLKDELARADRALGSVAPVLGHMLASPGSSLVSEEIVARVRGMLDDLAGQLQRMLTGKPIMTRAPASPAVQTLSDKIAADVMVLEFLHAAAVEAQIASHLEERASIEMVLSPLWQELIGSDDPVTAEVAMQALAAQSRLTQSSRRMQFALEELPAAVLERALRVGVRVTSPADEVSVTEALRAFKADYDEASTRVGLLARLVSSMGHGAIAALQLDHAGLALFASALASLSGQDRIHAILSCHDQQAARLVLGLRAAGLDNVAIERQFSLLDPASRLPDALSSLSVEGARAMLSGRGKVSKGGKSA